MRKWLSFVFLLIPTIILGQASYDVINVNYKADNLNFNTGNGSKFFNLVLTGNVNTSGLNGGSLGMEVIFNICQDNVGGRTFNWPPNVINPPPINSAALACTSTRFVNIGNFQWTNTGNANGTGAGTPAAGSPPQTQVNDPGNPGHFGGTSCENFPSLTVGPINADCDWHAKGPNPYVDITRFGARTCNPNNPPCASGITATINNGSSSATISSASTFINGDGVVIYGAGSASGLSTPAAPTVTNVLGELGTGTDLVVTGAAGATTKCYKIIARTTGGGYSPASPETCTTTGQSTLGLVTVNLSTCTRSATIVTCTTSSATPLLVGFGGSGAEVYIGGAAGVIDDSFRGWRPVTSATDSTHFTFQDSAINSNNGGPSGGHGGLVNTISGGTATFFVANHLSWTAVTGAWLYYIYGGGSGAETLIGVSRPQTLGLGSTFTTWDDFTNLMQNYVFPPWIPTTPPSVGGNNNLSTKIVSGAGTTTLTLAGSAGASVTNAGIRLDAGVGIAAAGAAANLKGPLFIPADPASAGQAFVVNNYCDLTPYALSVVQSGSLLLHETVALFGFGLFYSGKTIFASSSTNPGSTWGSYPIVNVAEAVPGIYLSRAGSFSFSGLNVINPSTQVNNGTLLMLTDTFGGLFNGYFEDMTFGTGTNSQDLMGFGLIIRGLSGITMDRVTYGNGGPGVDGAQNNTALFCNGCGDFLIRNSYSTHTGAIFVGGSGESVTLEADHYNGGFTPLLRTIGNNMSVTLGNEGFQIIMDTVGHPCLSAYGGNPVVVNRGCGASGYFFRAPSITGVVQSISQGSGLSGIINNALEDTLQTGLTESNIPFLVHNIVGDGGAGGGGISVGFNGDSIFVQGPPVSPPTCSVSAGGSITVGTYNFKIVPVWWNNQEGTASNASTNCAATSGNQTITVNWTVAGGNPKSMELQGSINGGGFGLIAQFSVNVTSVVLSTPLSGPGAPAFPLGGPSMILPANQGIVAPSYLTSSSSGFSSTSTATALTANRSTILPDASGLVEVAGYLNSAYDNFNRANGGLGSNWTAVLNALTITTNVVGCNTPTANCISAYTAISPSSDQFSQMTVTAVPVTNSQPGVLVRASNSAQTHYVYNCGPTQRQIFAIVAGSSSTVASVSGSCVVGDILRLEVSGTNLTAYYNGAVDLTGSDSSIASGFPGLRVFGNINTQQVDNWSGGNLHPIAQLDIEQDWTKPQHFIQPVTIGATNPIAGALPANTLFVPYIGTDGGTPTCSVTGAGTGATCGTFQPQSDDESGQFLITTGTTPGATGTITLTFNISAVRLSYCIFAPSNTGGANWNARATFFPTTLGGGSNNQAAWDNNGVNLSSTLGVTYICGRH